MYHFSALEHSSEQSVMRPLDWSRLRWELLWAYQGKPIYQQTDAPEAKAVMCWLMLQGQVVVESPSCGQLTAGAGQWLFLCDDKCYHRFTDDAQILSLRLIVQWPNERDLYEHTDWICFRGEDFPLLEKRSRSLIRHTSKIYGPNHNSEIRLTKFATIPCDFGQYMQMERAMLHWVICYDHVMQQLGKVRITMMQSDPRVRQCMQLIENLSPSRAFDEHELARTVGLSISQLNRIFSGEMGFTPKAYAEKLKINDAIRILTSTPLPIKELTFLMGFRQQSHFSNWFRKKTGTYPTRYRKEFQTAKALKRIIESVKAR